MNERGESTHAKRRQCSESGGSSAVDRCCRSASALWPKLQPVAYMLAWWTVSEWCGWSCRGVGAQPQALAGSGAESARSLIVCPRSCNLTDLPFSLAVTRAGRGFTSPDRDHLRYARAQRVEAFITLTSECAKEVLLAQPSLAYQ